MIRVQQEHSKGCAVATLAMIMGLTYPEALRLFPGDPDRAGGFGSFVIETILCEQGFAWARKYRVRSGFTNEPRAIWPPEPWADAHWCEVMTDAGAHAVVMLGDGRVLDPWTSSRTSLADYAAVNFVAAIARLPVPA